MVAGHSTSYPGCLSNLLTLAGPIELRVQRFREEFAHSVEEIRSRLTLIVGRAEEVGEQTAILGQRADEVDKDVTEVQRQTSALSDKLETSLTECERRQGEVEQQAVRLEVRTTLLESQDQAAKMEDLARQLEGMRERLALAESDAAKAKIASEDQQQLQVQNSVNSARLDEGERKDLLERLTSLEKRFVVSFPGPPSRSHSHP